jgi:hypothetical protein
VKPPPRRAPHAGTRGKRASAKATKKAAEKGNVRRIAEPPSEAAVATATKTIRAVMASLGKRRGLSNDDLEELFDRIDGELRALPARPWVLDVLDRVVGRSAQRKRDAIYVLVTLAGVRGAEERIVRRVEDANASVRLEVIGAIHRQRWLHLAPILAERLRVEADPSCRNALIVACGDLRAPETCNALLALAKRDLAKPTGQRHRILFHLRKHADARARPYFQAVFDAPLPGPPRPFDGAKEIAVLAAWGLLGLGPAPEAHAFLVAMLDDARIVHIDGGAVTGVEPGVSERAAQALADLHGLPFRWGKGDAAKIRARLRRLR